MTAGRLVEPRAMLHERTPSGVRFVFGLAQAAVAQAICSAASPLPGPMPERPMQANPFSPPLSNVADTAPPPLAAVAKPASVWVTQVVGALLACAAFYGLVKGLAPARQMSMFQTAFVVVVQAVVTAFFLAIVIGAQRRARYARWMGLLLVGAILVYSLVRIVVEVRLLAAAAGDGVPEHVGAVVGAGLVALLTGAWFRAYGFGKRAKAWFGLLPAGETVQATDRWKP